MRLKNRAFWRERQELPDSIRTFYAWVVLIKENIYIGLFEGFLRASVHDCFKYKNGIPAQDFSRLRYPWDTRPRCVILFRRKMVYCTAGNRVFLRHFRRNRFLFDLPLFPKGHPSPDFFLSTSLRNARRNWSCTRSSGKRVFNVRWIMQRAAKSGARSFGNKFLFRKIRYYAR